MEEPSISRRECFDIYNLSNKDRAKFGEMLQQTLHFTLPKGKLDHIVRDMEYIRSQKKKKHVDMDKIIAVRSEVTDLKKNTTEENQNQNTQGKKRKVHIVECKRHSLYDRTNELYILLNQVAKEENVAPFKLAARLMSRSVWEDENVPKGLKKKINDVGLSIFQNGDFSVALTIISDCELGRSKYNNLRKLCALELEQNILPHWTSVSDYRKTITPEIVQLPLNYDGYRIPILPAVQMTLSQMLTTLDVDNLPPNIVFKLKAGLDGSGNHKIFHQSNVTQSNNMILTVMAPLSLHNTSSGETIWEVANPNSPDIHRPLVPQTGKESRENLMTARHLSSEMNDLEANGIFVPNFEQKFEVRIDFPCFDRKAADVLQGTGGAYCDLCVVSSVFANIFDEYDI